MKKFVMLYYGYETPTREVMDAWSEWFASIGDSIVDPGSPLGPGREITLTGITELTPAMRPATGYTVISAESLGAAVEIAKGCPIIDSVRVYEAMSM